MTEDDSVFSIDPVLGAPMTVRLVAAPGAFELARHVDCAAGVPFVEFYDRRYSHEPGFPRFGQFIRRYCATSLLQGPAQGPLILSDDVSHWAVDPVTFARVRDWLQRRLDAAPRVLAAN